MVGVLNSGASGPGSRPGPRDIGLCSWTRNFTLTVPLWVSANCWENPTNCWGVTCESLASCAGGVEILLDGEPLHATEAGISSSSYEPV